MSNKPKKTNNGERILDEDTYTSALNSIIQRDFFPELPELETQLEILEAEQNNDYDSVRKLYQKLKQQSVLRKAGSTPYMTPRSSTPRTTPRSSRMSDTTPISTPTTTTTPSSKIKRGAQLTPNNSSTHNPFPGQVDEFCDPEEDFHDDYSVNGIITSQEGLPVNINLSLDKFHDRHTSEDNASFSQLLETTNKQRREKYSWLKETLLIEDKQKSQPLTLTSNNSTKLLTGEIRGGPEKIIKHSSTRMPPPLPPQKSLLESKKEDSQTYGMLGSAEAQFLAQKKLKNDSEKIDIDDVFKTPSRRRLEISSPQVGGYSFVSPIPSPSPDFDGSASPFITWGSVEGTPLLISAINSTPADLEGPSFKVPDTPSREKLALDLVEKTNSKKAKTPVRFSSLRGITKNSPLLSPGLRHLMQTKPKNSVFSPSSPHLKVRKP